MARPPKPVLLTRPSMHAWFVAASILGLCFPAAAQIVDNPLPPLSRQQPPAPVDATPADDPAEQTPEPEAIVLEKNENGSVTLTVAGASRREVVEQLGYGNVVEWLDQDVAGQAVRGRFSGDSGTIVRRLLERSNFLIAYADDAGTQRVARIIVYGANPLSSPPVVLPATAAVAKPAAARPAAPPPASAIAKKEQPRRSADKIKRRSQRTRN